MTNKTGALMARGAEFLGSDYAILCGAMSWVSERNLVSAISNAGGFGVIACGAMTPELLDAEIAATKALAKRPFGVNLITMHPQLFDLIGICEKHGVGHVVLAGGIPPKGSVEAIKAFGGKVLVFAPTLALAKKLLRSGADALVIEGSEAGGHIGPVATSVLAQEFLPELAEEEVKGAYLTVLGQELERPDPLAARIHLAGEPDPRLLRVLESRRVTRVGSSESIPVNVRVISATHKDLTELVKKSEFREDLFYRISVVPVSALAANTASVSPLRPRRSNAQVACTMPGAKMATGRFCG